MLKNMALQQSGNYLILDGALPLSHKNSLPFGHPHLINAPEPASVR
jgi:hypothetical protein